MPVDDHVKIHGFGILNGFSDEPHAVVRVADIAVIRLGVHGHAEDISSGVFDILHRTLIDVIREPSDPVRA